MIYMLQLCVKFEEDGVVDPLKYLCEMRQDRGGMIQTSVSVPLTALIFRPITRQINLNLQMPHALLLPQILGDHPIPTKVPCMPRD